MKKRSEQILRYLVSNGSKKETAISLKKKYNVTERTLRNDMVEINDFLKNLNISGIYFDSNGRLTGGPDFNAELIENELNNLDFYDYKLNPTERQLYISILLLWNKRYIIMKNLANQLYVSRITILNDFEDIKEDFENRGIEVISDSGKGVCVRCPMKEKLELLVDYFKILGLDVESNDEIFRSYLLNKLEIRYSINDVYSHVQDYLNINNIVLVNDNLYEIIICLFVLFNIGESLENDSLDDDIFDEIDNLMMYVGYKFNAAITLDMLDSFRNYRKNHKIKSSIKNVDKIEIYEVIVHFLAKIDKEMKTHLSEDSKLIESLVLHVKNMRDWDEMEFPEIHNTFIDYDKLSEVVDRNLYVLNRYFSYNINNNMKKSIILHICVSILRGKDRMIKPSVLIVCPGTMATGKLLEIQIKNFFDFDIVDVAPVNNVYGYAKKKHIDFVISAVSIKNSPVPVLKVHAVLTMEDVNFIQNTMYEFTNTRDNVKAFQLSKIEQMRQKLKTVLQNIDVSKDLVSRIENILEEYEINQDKLEKTAMGELLEEDSILLCKENISWEDGIRKAGGILLEKKYIGKKFIEQAIANIKEYGDYIILGQGVALAHAGKDCGVYKDGLSLLVSKSGIVFSDGETKVNFLFCFSSRGQKEFVELFQEIVKLGQDAEYQEILLNMNSEMLYTTLCFK